MKRSFITGTLGLMILVGVLPGVSRVAGQHEEMSHQTTTLFVARADAGNVVPAQKSNATATGAFILLVKGRDARLEYDLTFEGLQNGPARAIRLSNFGEGANGKVVHVICGPDGKVKPCPQVNSGTVTGVWSSEDRAEPLDPALVLELAAQRIYVEIESGPRGAAEVRSQLKQQSFMGMTRSFVSRLGRDGKLGEGVTGTAAFDFVRIDERRTFILFDLTVAGLKAPITAINITSPDEKEILLTLPVSADTRKGGATVSGQLDSRKLPQLTRTKFMEQLGRGNFSISLTTANAPAVGVRAKLVPLP